MTSPVLRAIQSETSEACLRALRGRGLAAGKWSDEHQSAYESRIVAIRKRWQRLRGE